METNTANMKKRRRRYTAPPSGQRCEANLASGYLATEGAQCMRKAIKDGFCRQHELKRHSKYCAVHFLVAGKETPCDCELATS